MPLFDHFALIARFYDRIFTRVNLEQIHEQLAMPANRLLDVGGGTGRVSGRLTGAQTVIVIDPSTAMLRAAGAKNGLQRASAHAERLPFPDNSIDRVLVVDAFHHFCDQEPAAGELLRVLAPGGRLVIEEPNIELWPVKLLALGERLALMGSRFYRPDAIRRMLEMHGGQVTVHTDDSINMWIIAEKPATA
ncbi:MAG: methyltransferase domain-containing protein [Anaerolineae bacterium]|nr:methyltransferase domain-containing protein [Anaerolineae bacterium]